MLFTNKEKGNFAKDPAVIKWKEKYYLYYTIKYEPDRPGEWERIGIGIAVSDDLEHWEQKGELPLLYPYEERGIGAPGAMIHNGQIHLFYQTYGNGAKDAICHATSMDGINFERNPENPVYHPTAEWSCGRAIDADVCLFNGKLFLYVATRDAEMKCQIVCGAWAEPDSDFGKDAWHEIKPLMLEPTLSWEQECIEAPATLVYDNKVYLFYGGAYNCKPQQIGCAVSEDGMQFTRIFEDPFLTNGKEGEWNSCESGHPYVFEDDGTYYLFYQGSADMGKTFYLSKREFIFENGIPKLK
ncbi:MAG: glycoside hydrolase [Ruminococcaceae bacterium]|nr:glycoside hydrolase [Oscillospiraceae bacterium]